MRKGLIKVIATTGQYVLLAPLFPFYILHLFGEVILEFAAWCVFGAWINPMFQKGDLRPWAMWLLDKEAALDGWRRRSIASLSSSPTSRDEASQ